MKKENTDKLTDKAFMRLIVTSALAILMCVICLCSTTWAWFSDSNASGLSSITASSCTMEITVGGQTYQYGTEIEPVTIPDGNGAVNVAMVLPAGSASGYCIIEFSYKDDNGETVTKTCYTQAVSNTVDGAPTEVSFKIVADESATVKITPRWGIYSGNACIIDGDVINVTTGLISQSSVISENETVEENETNITDTKTEEPSVG
jgi:hypothetical protein